MPDHPYQAVDELIRRVHRIAANGPDATHIMAETISDVDPYTTQGVLIAGAVYPIAQHIPAERQAATAAVLLHSGHR